MRSFIANSGLAARLSLVLVILILLTTLSAGAPAYLLARSQLERQAWERVDSTLRATESLYGAALGRVIDLSVLLAERPTLRQLILDGDRAALESYVRAFAEQSELDVIQVCGDAGPILVYGLEADVCDVGPAGEVALVGGQPILLAGQVVLDVDRPDSLGTAITGVRLDEQFLTELSANTGVEHTILSAAGQPLISTRPIGVVNAELRPEGWVLEQDGARFFAAQFPLPGITGGITAEVALPVDSLMETERDALTILVAGSGLAALAGVVLGVWFIRRLTAPLSELTEAAEVISRGDLGAPIPRFDGPPEVATLSSTLERSQATMLEALEERSQARDWLSTLVQSVVEGVITFDTRGRITFMSQGAETMTGWTGEEAVGRPINELFPMVGEAEGMTFLDRMPRAGEKREIETRARGGKSLVLAATGARMVPPNSDTVQVALVLRDVTEEQALRNLRSFFLANISHEFRTPLSTLNAGLELLVEQVDDLSPAEIRELLRPTQMSLLSLQTLIDNLLESSNIEAGTFALRRQPAALNEVISAALTIVRPLVERRRQTVRVTEPAQMAPVVVDKARLTQVLINLLSNASKYSPIGQPIDLRVQQRRGALRISVADRGPGIPAEERINVFRSYVRLGHETDQQGMGLGLYLAQKVTEAHGGEIGVDDRPGGGAVFWIEIPPGEGWGMKDEG